MVSFLDNEGLRYYDEKLKVWVEAKVEESSSISDEKIKELDEKVKTKVANSLDMSLDETAYVLTVKLLSESGEELSKATVDLPIEELIKDGRYDDTTKEIVLILENGTEIRVPVGDLVENKVDKLDTEHVVYATDGSTPAKTIGIKYTNLPFKGTIAIRDNIGSLQVPTAQDDTQAVNKGQMDTALDGKVDKTTESSRIYGTGPNGEPNLYEQNATELIPWSVPLRNGNGAIVAADAIQDNELVTKKQLNTGLAGKLDANGLSTEAAQYAGYTDSTKIKSNTTTILNLNTSDDIRGYGGSYHGESGWHISPNVINSSDSFSMTDANVYLESSSQEGIIGVNTTKNLPSGEVSMGATFDGHGLHLGRGLNGVATTLDITRDDIKHNDTTETWDNILRAPSKLDSKINKTSELNKLYGTQENGYQYLYNISKNADSYSVVQRTEFGTIKAEYPREDNDVATQGSVNVGLSKKLNRVNKESDYLSVYAVTDTGGDAFLKQRSDEALTWSVPIRFRQGQILAARSDIETDPEKLKDSNGNPIDTDNFLVTQGQLKEVDTKVNNRVQRTNSTYILYGTTGKDSTGNTTQSELPFRTTVSNNSIAQRTGTGQLKAATPVEKEDLTTKEYVDSEINKCVPNTRTINGKALDNNITLSAADIGLNLDNWAFSSNSFKNESNDGNIVMGTTDSGMVTLNYSGIQYSKTGQTAKTITWENLFAKLDKITTE